MNNTQNLVILVGKLESDPTSHADSATAKIDLTETIGGKQYPAFAFIKADRTEAMLGLMEAKQGDTVSVEGRMVKSQHPSLNKVVLADKIEKCN